MSKAEEKAWYEVERRLAQIAAREDGTSRKSARGRDDAEINAEMTPR